MFTNHTAKFVSRVSRYKASIFKAADLRNIQCTKKSLVTNISKYLFKYIVVVRNKKIYLFPLFCIDNSLFCHQDIPTIHNGYCVSNAIEYAKKNNVLPTILSTELRGQYNKLLH